MTEAQETKLPALVPTTRGEELITSCHNAPTVLENEEDSKGVTLLIKMLRSCAKAIEARRTEVSKPILDALSILKAQYDVVTLPLKDWEERLNGVLTEYQVKKDREAQEAARKEQEAAVARTLKAAEQAEESGDTEAAEENLELAVDTPAPVAAETKVQPDVGVSSSLQKKRVPDFEKVKIEEVPYAYLMIDERKVKAVLKAGASDIPGIPMKEVAKSRVV